MFAACSSSEEALTQDATDVIDEENVGYEHLVGTTPIEFAGVTVGGGAEFEVEEITRSNTTGVPENSQIGVFCLAYKKLDSSLSDTYFSWSKGIGEKYNMLNLWQDNTKAHIEFGNNTPNSGVLYWDDPDVPHYYSKYDYFAYQFAAYQPYTDAIQYAKSTIYAWIPLDGDDDVIYAVSDKPRNNVVTDELAAYSYGNHYFSEAAALGDITADHKPYFTFNHLLAQVNFDIKLKEGASTSGHTFRVDGIRVGNLINIVRLKVANKDAPTFEDGALNYYSDVTSIPTNLQQKFTDAGYTGRGYFYLREKDGSSISDAKTGNAYTYELSTTKKTIGNGIFIPPLGTTLKVEIFLCDEKGNRFTSSEPITVNKPSSAGWKAGKHYTIPITVTPPKYFMDETRGTVVQWVNDTEASAIEEIEDEF